MQRIFLNVAWWRLALLGKVVGYSVGDSETSSEWQVLDSDSSEQAYARHDSPSFAWFGGLDFARYDGLDTSTKLSTG